MMVTMELPVTTRELVVTLERAVRDAEAMGRYVQAYRLRAYIAALQNRAFDSAA